MLLLQQMLLFFSLRFLSFFIQDPPFFGDGFLPGNLLLGASGNFSFELFQWLA
jgi:hypothetical protein